MAARCRGSPSWFHSEEVFRAHALGTWKILEEYLVLAFYPVVQSDGFSLIKGRERCFLVLVILVCLFFGFASQKHLCCFQSTVLLLWVLGYFFFAERKRCIENKAKGVGHIIQGWNL